MQMATIFTALYCRRGRFLTLRIAFTDLKITSQKFHVEKGGKGLFYTGRKQLLTAS